MGGKFQMNKGREKFLKFYDLYIKVRNLFVHVINDGIYRLIMIWILEGEAITPERFTHITFCVKMNVLMTAWAKLAFQEVQSALGTK